MTPYWRFLVIGLILGLFTEVQLKLIARSNPSAFLSAVFIYPVILTVSYSLHKFIDRQISSLGKGDMLHYLAAGFSGLGIEWGLLGNGPGSNAYQLGMFAMWTTFCFGPRVLTRDSQLVKAAQRKFWPAFGLTALLLTSIIFLAPDPKAKIVIAVLGLTGTYTVWSGWLLVLAWRTRPTTVT